MLLIGTGIAGRFMAMLRCFRNKEESLMEIPVYVAVIGSTEVCGRSMDQWK